MNARDELRLALRIRFGLPDYAPTEEQLARIIARVRIVAAVHEPTDKDWKAIVTDIVPRAGFYLYKGLDMSDLNALLELIQNEESI